MRGGTLIAIRDMDDGHLLNTIRMLVRRAPFIAVAEIARMPRPRGDMAMDGFGAEVDRMGRLPDVELASELFPSFGALCAEADRRKLDY
jgi:hypothetical protein